MAKQKVVDNLAPKTAPEPSPTGEFTLGADAPGSGKPLAESRESGVWGFILLVAIALFFLGSAVYDKTRKKP